MVYMTPEELGWEVYMKSWMKRIFNIKHDGEESERTKYVACHQLRIKEHPTLELEPKYQDHLLNLFLTQYQTLLHKTAAFEEPFPTVEIQRVRNVCNIIEKLISDLNVKFVGTKEDLTKKLNYIFTYAVIWGLGASFD
jgi:hypothetical protein